VIRVRKEERDEVHPGGAAAPYNPNAGNFSGRGNVVVAGATPINPQPAAPINPYTGAAAPNYAPTAATTYSPAGANANAADFRQLPIRNVRTQTVQPDHAPIDPAVQYINMAVQKQQVESKGRPFPPLPPVPGLDQ